MAPLQVILQLLITVSCLDLSYSLTGLTKSRRMLETAQHRVDSLQSLTTLSTSRKILSNRNKVTLKMRDASCAYWFNVGESVKVTSTVIKAGIDLRGRTGQVINTWEKCEVDPTCCCAEFVDDNFAVTVKFDGKADLTAANGEEFIKGIDTGAFTHFFNEDELVKVQENDNHEEMTSIPVAFDGMSCKAFKLDQLKMGKQAQRLSAYEASVDQLKYK
jgi:hypothetical protein